MSTEASYRPRAGTKSWRTLLRTPLFDIGQFMILLAAGAWFFTGSISDSGYNWQWYQIPRYILSSNETGLQPGPLLQGLFVTLQLSGISLILAFCIGLGTALLQLSRSFIGSTLARIYLEIVRNTPLLIQIFFIYFVLGPTLGLGRFFSAVLALSLFEGAYTSEIIRAGIVSLHRGQWEAAYSLGLSTTTTYQHIILPQALRRILPPLTGQAISLVKDSALVSTIAIYDLTMQAQAIIAETYLTFEIWFTVALMYLCVTVTISLLVRLMERRIRIY